MAVDFGVLVRADISEITADVLAEITSRLLAVLQWRTVTLAHAAAYSAAGTDNLIIVVSGGGTVGTIDWGFRITVDNAMGVKNQMLILAQVLQVLQPYTHDSITFAVTYVAGAPTYQVVAALT